jgi:FkbM family methyltransferase
MRLLDELRRAKAYVNYWGSVGALKMYAAEAHREAREVAVSSRIIKGELRLRTHSSDIETFAQVIGAREYDIPELGDLRTIIDAGANIGLATVFFSERFPAARIIALEPEDSNFDLLCRNAANRPNVTCLKKALWSESGTVTVVDPGQGQWAFRTHSAKASGKSSERVIGTVECVTVADLMRNYDLERIDLLKVDIEGAEKEVFESSAAWIHLVDVIAIELHDRFKRGCAKAFYDATAAFDREVHRGENVFVLRDRSPGRVG